MTTTDDFTEKRIPSFAFERFFQVVFYKVVEFIDFFPRFPGHDFTACPSVFSGILQCGSDRRCLTLGQKFDDVLFILQLISLVEVILVTGNVDQACPDML